MANTTIEVISPALEMKSIVRRFNQPTMKTWKMEASTYSVVHKPATRRDAARDMPTDDTSTFER
jgi:hypothetical protein